MVRTPALGFVFFCDLGTVSHEKSPGGTFSGPTPAREGLAISPDVCSEELFAASGVEVVDWLHEIPMQTLGCNEG